MSRTTLEKNNFLFQTPNDCKVEKKLLVGDNSLFIIINKQQLAYYFGKIPLNDKGGVIMHFKEF